MINHMERWHFDFVDDESDAIALDQLRDSDAMLMGRRTYEIYVVAWPDRGGEYADGINAITKYVVSSTPLQAEWANTTVLTGDLAEAVPKLKQAHDRDILMHGESGVQAIAEQHVVHGPDTGQHRVQPQAQFVQ